MRVVFHHRKNGLSAFFASSHEAECLLGDFVVNGLHALLGQRAGALDFLGSVRVRPCVDHSAGAVFLLHFRVFEVVGVLRLILGIQVVERAKELVEAVRRGQVLVEVAEVVLAELARLVALRLEQLGERHIARLQAFLEQAGAEGRLSSDERRAPCRAALLAVPVGEQRAVFGDAVDIGRLVAHHALVIGTDVPVADVIAPQNENVRFATACRRRGGLRLLRSCSPYASSSQCEQRAAAQQKVSAIEIVLRARIGLGVFLTLAHDIILSMSYFFRFGSLTTSFAFLFERQPQLS
jgi:hypothetical protein